MREKRFKKWERRERWKILRETYVKEREKRDFKRERERRYLKKEREVWWKWERREMKVSDKRDERERERRYVKEKK